MIFVIMNILCEWENGVLPTTIATNTRTTTTTIPFTSHEPAIRVTVCDSNPLNIERPNGYSIYVFNAFFGRTQNNICGSSWYTNCIYDNATISLRERLIGYQSISVKNFISDLFGKNPCPGVSKYAIIDYLSVPNKEFLPIELNCAPWMQTVDFKSVDGSINECRCSNSLTVSWYHISDCTPIQTKFYFYKGFITGNAMAVEITTTTGHSHAKCLKNSRKYYALDSLKIIYLFIY